MSEPLPPLTDEQLELALGRLFARWQQSTPQLEEDEFKGPVREIVSDDCTHFEFKCKKGRSFDETTRFRFKKEGKASWVETVKHAYRNHVGVWLRMKFTGEKEPFEPTDITETSFF